MSNSESKRAFHIRDILSRAKQRVKKPDEQKEVIQLPNTVSENLQRESKDIAWAIQLFEVLDTNSAFTPEDKDVIYTAMSHTLFNLMQEAAINQTADISLSPFGVLADLREDFGSGWQPDLTTSLDDITRQRALYHIGSGSILATRDALVKLGKQKNVSHIDALWMENIHGQLKKEDSRVGWYYVYSNIALPKVEVTESLNRDYRQFLSSSSPLLYARQ